MAQLDDTCQEIDSASVSRTFNLAANPLADICLISSDASLFFVHAATIRKLSPGAFTPFVDQPPANTDQFHAIYLECPSTVLNILLHALYDISPEAYEPSADIIVESIDMMPAYAITPRTIVNADSNLYNYILTFLPLRPLDFYSLAAHHSIHPLAVHASSYLHGLDLQSIPETLCIRMGPVYLLRLAQLHIQRFNTLKDALIVPPELHPATPMCDLRNQERATRVWALLCAEPIWEMKPVDLAVQIIEPTLQHLMDNLPCPDCRENLERAAAKVRLQWASVPVSEFKELLSIFANEHPGTVRNPTPCGGLQMKTLPRLPFYRPAIDMEEVAHIHTPESSFGHLSPFSIMKNFHAYTLSSAYYLIPMDSLFPRFHASF